MLGRWPKKQINPKLGHQNNQKTMEGDQKNQKNQSLWDYDLGPQSPDAMVSETLVFFAFFVTFHVFLFILVARFWIYWFCWSPPKHFWSFCMKSLDLLSKTIHFHTHRWITKQNQTFVFKSLDLLILRQDVRPHCPDLLGNKSRKLENSKTWKQPPDWDPRLPIYIYM